MLLTTVNPPHVRVAFFPCEIVSKHEKTKRHFEDESETHRTTRESTQRPETNQRPPPQKARSRKEAQRANEKDGRQPSPERCYLLN